MWELYWLNKNLLLSDKSTYKKHCILSQGQDFHRDIGATADQLIPQHNYRLEAKVAEGRHYGEVACKEFWESVLRVMPHRWTFHPALFLPPLLLPSWRWPNMRARIWMTAFCFQADLAGSTMTLRVTYT